MPKQQARDLTLIAPDLHALAVPIGDLVSDPENARQHNDYNIEVLKYSLRKFSQRKPVVVNSRGYVVEAGNGLVEAARQLGMTHLAAVRVDDDKRAATEYALLDNRSAELSAWDPDQLPKTIRALREQESDLSSLGFDDDYIGNLLDEPGNASKGGTGRYTMPEIEDPDVAPPPESKPITTQIGMVWRMGDHRLFCGDSKNAADLKELMGGKRPDVLCGDPPYCSGGFREADRAAGSWADNAIAADNLSTRGFQAMIGAVLTACRVSVAYLFTDWRMWIPLYDCVESNSLAVRAMIVWDKETPALGALWRAQFELVMFASRHGKGREPGTPTMGNVIRCKRSGNKNHYTEKPVELVAKLLHQDSMGAGGRSGLAYDPFCGSGTLILACEQLKRVGYGVELEPKHCDTAVRRWVALSGQTATGWLGGKKVAEIAPEGSATIAK